MYFTKDAKAQFNDLLNIICEKLQIDNTRFKQAETSYKAVTDLLQGSGSFFNKYNVNMYPHGSFVINTTVKPLSGDEFDLDFVMETNIDWAKTNPVLLLDKLEEELGKNDVYNKIKERKNRCIRLNYANQFHMDIMPSCINATLGGGNIKIPDREKLKWEDSNPKGFALWFEEKCKLGQPTKEMVEKLAAAQPLQQDLPYEIKPPLKLVVQLMKRYRDIYFQKKPDVAPKSIILTTLAGVYYKGETDLSDAISNIVASIYGQTNVPGRTLEIVNPVNASEKYSDKWIKEPQLYKEFISFMAGFYDTWGKLMSIESMESLSKYLTILFGETTTTAFKVQAEYLGKQRLADKLGVNRQTGNLTSSQGSNTTQIVKNTFYN